MAETIDEFLVDFYKKKNNEDITVEKIQEIKNTYGNNYNDLITDLYSKYGGDIDEEKIKEIKSVYEFGKEDVKEDVKEETTKVREEPTEFGKGAFEFTWGDNTLTTTPSKAEVKEEVKVKESDGDTVVWEDVIKGKKKDTIFNNKYSPTWQAANKPYINAIEVIEEFEASNNLKREKSIEILQKAKNKDFDWMTGEEFVPNINTGGGSTEKIPSNEFKELFGEDSTIKDVDRIKENIIFYQGKHEEQTLKDKKKTLEEFRENYDPTIPTNVTEDVELEETPVTDYLADLAKKYDEADGLLSSMVSGVSEFLTEEREGMDMSIAKRFDIQKQELDKFEETSKMLIKNFTEPSTLDGEDKEVEEEQINEAFTALLDKDNIDNPLNKVLLLAETPEGAAKVMEETGLTQEELNNFQKSYTAIQLGKEKTRQNKRWVDNHINEVDKLTMATSTLFGGNEEAKDRNEIYKEKIREINMNDPEWRDKFWDDNTHYAIFRSVHAKGQNEEDFHRDWEPFLNSWGMNIYPTAGGRFSQDRMSNAVTVSSRDGDSLILYTNESNHDDAQGEMDKLFDFVKKHGSFIPPKTPEELVDSNLSAWTRNLIDTKWMGVQQEESELALQNVRDKQKELIDTRENFDVQIKEKVNTFYEEIQNKAITEGWTSSQYDKEVNAFNEKIKQKHSEFSSWYNTQSDISNVKSANEILINKNSTKVIEGVNNMLSEYGTWESIVADKFVTGVDKIVDGAAEYIIAGAVTMGHYGGAMEMIGIGGSLDEKIKAVRGAYNQSMRSPFSRVMSTGASDTEYGRALMDDWLYGDLLNLVENAPAMLASIGTGGIGGLSKIGSFAVGSTPFALYQTASMMEEMDNMVDQDGNHYLANMPEWKKWSVILPTVGVVSALERFGVDRITPGKGWILNTIAMNSMKKAPKYSTKAQLNTLVASEVDNYLARGIIRVVDGALVEGVTEGAQQIVEMSFKETFEYFEEMGMESEPIIDAEGKIIGYKNPNIWSTAMDQGGTEVVVDILRAMRGGFFGGTSYGTVGTVFNGNQTYSFGKDSDPLAFEYTKMLLQNKHSLKSLEDMLEAKAQNGKLSKKQLEERKRSLAVAGGIFKQIESNIDVVDQKIVYDLTLEKQDLKNTIEKKGKNNAAWEVERVKVIENELSDISIYSKENSVDIGNLRGLSKVLMGRTQSNLSKKQIETVKGILENRNVLDGLFDFSMVEKISNELNTIEQQLIKENNTAAASDIAKLNTAINNTATKEQFSMHQDKDAKVITDIINQVSEGAYSDGRSYFVVDNKLVSQREFEQLLEDKDFINDIKTGDASYTVVNPSQNFKNKIQESELLSPEKMTEEGIGMMEEVVPTGKIKSVNTSEEFYTAAKEKGIKFSQKDIEEGAAPTALITPTGEILIDKQRASEVKDVTAVGHEVFHRLLDSKFEIKNFDDWKTQDKNLKKTEEDWESEKNELNKKKNKTISKFKNILQKRNKQAFKEIQERVKGYVNDGILTEEESVNSDEWVTGFFDLVGSGKLTFKNEGFWVNVGDWIREVLFKPFGYNNLNFKSGRQVYDFAKDYGAQFKRGELDKKTKQAITEAFDKDIVSGKKFSTTETPLEAINNLIPDAIKTKEQYDEFIRNERTAKPIVDALNKPGGVINNYIRSRQETQAEGNKMIEESLFRLFNFNPEAKRKDGTVVGKEGFGEAIFANTRFAKLVARKKLFEEGEKKKKTTSIDDEQARQLTVSPETKTTKVEDKKARVTPRAKLIRDFPEIFDQELKDDFETAGLEIFESPTPEVEGKEFKGFITEAFRGKTTAKVKKKLGAGKRYEFNVKKLASKLKENLPIQWFVRMEGSTPVNQKKFTSPPTRLTKQEDIDKAMLDDKVYVEVTSQGVNTYEFKDFTAKDLADFILAPLVSPTTGKKSGTRGTRKTGLAEGLVDLFGRQVSPTVIEKVEEKGVKEKLPQISKKLQVDPRTKFSKSVQKETSIKQIDNLVNNKNILFSKVPSISIGSELVRELSSWKSLIKEYKGKDGEYLKPLDLKTKKDRYIYKDWVLNKLTKKLPKEFFKGGFFTGGNKTYLNGVHGWVYGKEFEKALKSIEDFADTDIDITNAVTKINKGSVKVDGKILKFGEKEFVEFNDSKLEGVRKIFEVFSEMINENSDNIRYIGQFLSSTSSNMTQFLRVAAPWRFTQKNLEGKKTIEEHTLPVSFTAKYLLERAIQKNVDDYWYGIEQNFFQGLISKENDSKLKDLPGDVKRKLTHFPPVDYSYDIMMGDKSIWLRYFNNFVNNNNNGFNSNEITLENGRTLATEFNVEVDKKFQNDSNVILKQNEQIEQQLLEEVNSKFSKSYIKDFQSLAPGINKSRISNIKKAQGSGVVKFSKSIPNSEVIRQMGIMDKALNIARDPNAPVKKIRVFDFDDTLAQTKSKVFYTMPDEVRIYHGGSVNTIKDIDGISYFSESQDQAKEYAKGNEGKVQSFIIKENNIASEDIVYDEINRLNLKAGENYDVNELNLYELIDLKFDTSLSKSDLNKLIDSLKSKGLKAVRFRDMNLQTLKNDINNIMVFDKNVIQNENKLTAEQFADKGTELKEQGAEFDFSDFDKVVKGKKGPLFEVAQTIAAKRGTEDLFVLTARGPDAAIAIKEFLDGIGLDIPLKNITGLGDSSPLAKSGWIVDKAAEGYNDFYFADDHGANVQAVQDALDALPVKGKTQQAKVKFSKQNEYITTPEDWKLVPSKYDFPGLKDHDFKIKIAGEGKDRKHMIFWKEDGKGDWEWEAGNLKRQLRSAVLAIARRKLPIEESKAKFSMNTKRDLKWKRGDFGYAYRGENPDFYTSFKVKDKTYNIRLTEEVSEQIEKDGEFIDDPRDLKIYELDFGLASKSAEKGKGNLGLVNVTGTGNAAEVLSIVSNGIFDFVKNNKVDNIIFSSDASSRSRLYKTLAKLWGNKLGWGVKINMSPSGAGVFEISKDIENTTQYDNQSKPEREVLDVVDVKSKVQQKKTKFSKTVDKTFNDILEQKTGIEAFKEYSAARAKTIGANKGKFNFLTPPSADDFTGLLYRFLGKGKVGDAQMAWFKEHLLNPFARAMENVSNDRVQLMNDFTALKKELVKSGAIPKNLKKKAIDNFTKEDIIRVMAWNQQGIEVEGLSKRDLVEFTKYIEDNPGLQLLIDQLVNINKGDGYAYPGKNWLAGTITTDLIEGLNTTKRSKYLQQWQENVDLIFSEKNLNKVEAAFGSRYREALEDSLRRMKTGRNRKSTGGRLENRILDYINNSIGTVMFLNMRSGVLQTISAINFMNWSFNNPLKAGRAFANQKQYWKDWMHLINSDYLVDRRNGLRINVSESEIADAARGQENKSKAVIAYLLKKGFLVTQIMDSVAIASGGATFYRNKIKDLMKKNPDMKIEEAEAEAFTEFYEISEESQQSSRPDRISQQQASGAGRVILAFANTPMQYNRIIKKATLDLVNGRGDYKTNLSKIVYYGMVQNVMFSALQQAIFAIGFDDEEKEANKEKYYKIGNSMIDNLLRGLGIGGQAIMTGKNLAKDVYMRYQKSIDPNATWYDKQPHYEESAWKVLDFSPPLSIKLRKLVQAAKNWQYNEWRHDKDPWSIDDPAYLSGAYVISSFTNIPLDRLVKKITNARGAVEADQDWWKRVALLSGWQEWELETSSERKGRKEDEKEVKFYDKTKANPGLYSKDEQVYLLKKYGLTDVEVESLNTEKKRVKIILDFQKATGDTHRPPKSIKQYTDFKNNTTKAEQEEMLRGYGYSKSYIKDLKYEDNRVELILKEYEKRKKKQ